MRVTTTRTPPLSYYQRCTYFRTIAMTYLSRHGYSPILISGVIERKWLMHVTDADHCTTASTYGTTRRSTEVGRHPVSCVSVGCILWSSARVWWRVSTRILGLISRPFKRSRISAALCIYQCMRRYGEGTFVEMSHQSTVPRDWTEIEKKNIIIMSIHQARRLLLKTFIC